jgi:hypothetical protein
VQHSARYSAALSHVSLMAKDRYGLVGFGKGVHYQRCRGGAAIVDENDFRLERQCCPELTEVTERIAQPAAAIPGWDDY